MQITDVRLRRVNSEGRMKAIASITIDNEFVVHDIRVIDGNNGMFVAMPSKRTPDGEFRDIAHPISSSTREKKFRPPYWLNMIVLLRKKKLLKKVLNRLQFKRAGQALFSFTGK